jgi:hypothetical protein
LLLTFRCSLRHSQAHSRGADAPAVDATLAELAAVDPAAAAVLRDAEALIEGNLTRAPRSTVTPRCAPCAAGSAGSGSTRA